MNVMLFLIAFLFDPTASLYSQISLKASTGTANGIYTTIRSTFTAINAGTHSGNNFCPDDSATVLVNVQASCNWLGLEESSGTNVALYPNPTTGNLFVQLNAIETINAVVYDAQGKLIATINNLKNGSVIDLTSVETGIYMIHLNAENASMIQRVIKN
jgi:hypothetical protein